MKYNNWVDLSSLPRKGKLIDWSSTNNTKVKFSYNGIEDECIVNGLDKEDRLKLIVYYNNKEYKINRDNFKTGHLGQFFNFSVKDNFNYESNQIINKNNNSIKIISPTRMKASNNRTQKGYNITCLICGYNFQNTENNLNRGDMCPVCSNHKIIKGINDIWTTNPEVGKFLTNPEDGYKYAQFSNIKLDFTCPECKTYIGKKLISTVSNNGISCPACGENISYPNKFMYHLLNILDEEFETEQGYDWCVFPSYKNKNIMNHGRFDFLLPKRKIIIEMDCSLGHGRTVYTNSKISVEETLYKDKMKDKIAAKKGYKVIRINCEYSSMGHRFKNCVNGVINSELATIFDLTNIDWNKINNLSIKGSIITVASLYNEGKSTGEIAKILKKNLSTIINYLHQATSCGLCEFVSHSKNRKRGDKSA